MVVPENVMEPDVPVVTPVKKEYTVPPVVVVIVAPVLVSTCAFKDILLNVQNNKKKHILLIFQLETKTFRFI